MNLMTCIRCKSVLPRKLIFETIIYCIQRNYYLNTLVIVTVNRRKRCTNEKVLKLQRYSLSFAYYNVALRVSFFLSKTEQGKVVMKTILNKSVCLSGVSPPSAS